MAVRVELKDEMPGLGKVIVYSTHFQHNNAKTRLEQMRALIDHAQKDLNPNNTNTTVTVFLLGDFNHHPKPGHDEFLDMAAKAGFIDLAAAHAKATGTEPHHTANFKNSPIRIDYIFASRQVNITDVTVLDSNVSDHLPLSVTITP